MSTKTDGEVARETLQRVIRVETRLMTLGSKMGFDLKNDEAIAVNVDTREVVLQSLDVAYTSVINKCRRLGLHKKKIKVYYDGEEVATMPV